jgi:hypothetical protein
MTVADNPGRARILDRIRVGLRAPAPECTSASPDSLIFEPVSDPLKRFQQEAAANLIECLLTSDTAGSARQLAQVLESLPQGEIFVQDDPSLRQLVEASRVTRPVRWSSQGGPKEASQATITLVEALIAQTGSI